MKKRLFTIGLVVIFLVGVGLLAYPSFSDWWNALHQSHAVATYVESVNQLTNDEYTRMWDEAQAYNEELKARGRISFFLTEEEKKVYNSLLDVTGTSIMGYVDIPKLDVTIPIYHGTDEAVLQIAIGHVAGTSLPVGGDGTHCVISGHRGLPRAKLFTELDKMEVGDVFTLHVLDSVLYYEVDQISIVLPGYKKEDVTAELKDGYMTISAESKKETENKDANGRYIRRERFVGSCSRTFYVGDAVTEEDIKARFEDGVLKVSVPKKVVQPEIPQKKIISID